MNGGATRQTKVALVNEVLSSAFRSMDPTGKSCVAREALARALYADRLEVRVGDLGLRAWLTTDLELALVAWGSCAWGPACEHALRTALQDMATPLAQLLLGEWDAVCVLCRCRGKRPMIAPARGARTSPSELLN
jgi:hypothetical protein